MRIGVGSRKVPDPNQGFTNRRAVAATRQEPRTLVTGSPGPSCLRISVVPKLLAHFFVTC